MNRFQFSIFVVLLLSLSMMVSASDRYVPDDYSTIQAAINSSVDGDTIIVDEGTYYERITVESSITLTSTDPSDPSIVASTIINAGGSGSALTFSGSEISIYSLIGFTITGARSGGIDCTAGDLTVSNCKIINNRANSGNGKGAGITSDDSICNITVINCQFTGNQASVVGGAIFSDFGVLTVIGSTFINNTSSSEGGAIAVDQANATIDNCLFMDNSSKYGGGMHNSHFSATVTNSIFAYNSASNIGGAICAKDLRDIDKTQRMTNCTFYANEADQGGATGIFQSGGQVLTNCILWDNFAYSEGPQVAGGYDSGDITVRYSCVQGGDWDIYSPNGTLHWLSGNIDPIDPYFANIAANDFHLKSTEGRWDDNSNTWVTDNHHSPCIDAGDPGSDWTPEVWPNGQRINMGAYGGTEEASKSLSTDGNIADIDNSGEVNITDIRLMMQKWLDPNVPLQEDLDGDGKVNLKDFTILANNWGWKQ